VVFSPFGLDVSEGEEVVGELWAVEGIIDVVAVG
jgi:hypothetical protein